MKRKNALLAVGLVVALGSSACSGGRAVAANAASDRRAAEAAATRAASDRLAAEVAASTAAKSAQEVVAAATKAAAINAAVARAEAAKLAAAKVAAAKVAAVKAAAVKAAAVKAAAVKAAAVAGNGISLAAVEAEAAHQWRAAYATQVQAVSCNTHGLGQLKDLAVGEAFDCQVDGPGSEFTVAIGSVSAQRPYFTLTLMTD